MIIMLLVVFGGMLSAIGMYVRNRWVFRKRMHVLYCQGIEEYHRLPSYNRMMGHFWVWDLEKFKGKGG